MAANNNADDYAASRIGIYFQGFPHSLTGQCVSLVKWFIGDKCGVSDWQAARGNAKDFGDTLVRQGLAVEVPVNERRRGDVLVWPSDGGGLGHAGVMLSDDRVFEENVGIKGSPSVNVEGLTVFASRIDSFNAPWRKGAARVYRMNGYVEVNPAPASGSTDGFEMGDVVTVTNPVDVNGVHLATSGNYTVVEISNGSIVIGRDGTIIARLLAKNIALVSRPIPQVDTTFAVGDTVTVLNPTDIHGTHLATEGEYQVVEVSDGSVVIGRGSAVIARMHPNNLTKVSAAPTPPPAPVTPPSPNTVYTKLGQPMDLVLNKDTSEWDLGFVDYPATAVRALKKGDSFKAYGRAQRTDLNQPAYFMTQEDFGDADTTGRPVKNVGINTLDLSPVPAPEAPAPDVVKPAVDGEQIPVHVGTWQGTYQALPSPAKYIANSNVIVNELDTSKTISDTHPSMQQLVRSQPVMIAGTFTKDGAKYYRTVNSVTKGNWYGIPVAALTKYDATASESGFDHFLATIDDEVKKLTHKK